MTLDDVKNLRGMFDNHMDLPADQMAELFDLAEATFEVVKPKAKAKAEPVAEAPVADVVVAQG